MKTRIAATALLTSSLYLTTSQAQLIPFLTNTKPQPEDLRQQQSPMNNAPGIQLPSDPNNRKEPSNNKPSGSILLADIIGTQSQIQIFSGLVQDVASISKRLDTSSKNTTLLAPSNKAITSLPHKPWESAQDYSALGVNAYSGKEGEDRAHANLRRFVERHAVGVSPWNEGEEVETLSEEGEGKKVWWEKKDGKTLIQPAGVEVESVANRVANGEVWVLKGCLTGES